MISHQKQQINLPDYIPLLQSEDILKTAEYRQNLVDQNLSSVKDAVDSYSKLRSYMINDNARNYFDQELKKLTSTIRDSAGLDFSNKGNLANVLAIGKPFENDKYIVNGLKWGKEKQRRMSELSSVDDEMRNSDNDLVFMNDIYEYEREGGLDSKVNTQKSYTPYVDVTEEILKIEKEIQGEMKIELQKVQGNPGLLKEFNIEEKTADAVKRRIENLSPELQQQVNIHAQAEMIRMGKENTYKMIKESQLNQLNFAQAKINQGQQTIAFLQRVPQTEEVKQKITDIQEAVMSFSRQAKVLEEEIQQPADKYDPNQYLAIFRNRFLDGLAEKAAYTKTKVELREDKVYLENLNHSHKMSEIQESAAKEIALAQIKNVITTTTPLNNTRIDINPSFISNFAINDKKTNLLAQGTTSESLTNLAKNIQVRMDQANLNSSQETYLTRVIGQLMNMVDVLNQTTSGDYIDLGIEKAALNLQPIESLLVQRDKLRNTSIEDVLKLGYLGIRRLKTKETEKEESLTPQEEKIAEAAELKSLGAITDAEFKAMAEIQEKRKRLGLK